jgi:hypothetical protein
MGFGVGERGLIGERGQERIYREDSNWIIRLSTYNFHILVKVNYLIKLTNL